MKAKAAAFHPCGSVKSVVEFSCFVGLWLRRARLPAVQQRFFTGADRPDSTRPGSREVEIRAYLRIVGTETLGALVFRDRFGGIARDEQSIAEIHARGDVGRLEPGRSSEVVDRPA